MAVLESPNGRFPSARGEEPRMPGGATVTRLLAGFDGVVQSNAAASQEVRKVARELQIANERQMRMGATIQSLVQQQGEIIKMLSSQVAQAPAAVLGGMGSAAPVGAGVPAAPAVPHFVSDDPYQRHGSTVRPTSTWLPPGASEDTGQSGVGLEPITRGAGVPASAPDNYARLQAARGYSLSTLRADAGRWIGSKVSQASFGPALKQNPSGMWMTVDRATGATTGIASEAQIRRAALANRVRGVGGMVAEQGVARGLINAMPKGAIAAGAGVVGGANILLGGLQFAQQQRSMNAEWQSILGGENVEGFGERANQFMANLEGMLGLGPEGGGALYKRATEIGLRGDERQDAIDLAMRKFQQFGADINKTMDLIATSTRAGLRGLTGIAEGIDIVTQAARESDVNANVARQTYSEAFTAATGTLMGEGSAAVSASALTAAFTRLGEPYAAVNVGAAFNNDVVRRLGAMQGWSEAETIANTSGAQGGQTYTRMVQGAIMDVANRLLGDRGRAIIAEYKRKNAVRGSLTPEQASAVALEIMRANIINPSTAQASIRAYAGLDIPLNQAVAFLVSTIDGTFNPEGQVSEQAVASSQQTISRAGRNNFETNGGDVDTMGEVIESIGGDLSLDVAQDPWTYDENGNYVEGERRMLMDTSKGRGRGLLTGARGLYAEQVQAGGKFSPIVAGALRQGDQDQRFRINVGTETNPEWREMDIYDAIKYHSDQVARGDVLVTEGQGKGQTLASALGLQVDESTKVTYSGAGADAGEEWTSGTGAGGTGQAVGQIEVFASPELQSLLRFRPLGDTTVVTPPSSVTSPGSLPSGSYTTGGR